MLPDRRDTLIALKAIALSPDLTGMEKRVAVAIIDHFNRFDGRCDPGIARLASLLDCSERTILRSLSRLHDLDHIRKVRHGGQLGRNSYQPNWEQFREFETKWKAVMHKPAVAGNVTAASPPNGQTCHLGNDKDVTQTCPKNLSNEPVGDGVTSKASSRSSGRCERHKAWEKGRQGGWPDVSRRRGASSQTVAERAAQHRWDSELLQLCVGGPDLYEQVIAAITLDMASEATKRELRRKGSGIAYIIEALTEQGLLLPDTGSGRASGECPDG